MQEKYIQSRLNGNSTNSCKWEVIFFYSCCTLSAVVIFIEAFESFSYDIWVDEAFSLRMIEHSWFEIVQLTAMDVHPPLYYFILKLGVGITHNISGIPIIVCAKLVSVMPILILWIMNVLYIRPRYGNVWRECFRCVLPPRRILLRIVLIFECMGGVCCLLQQHGR